MPPHARFLPRYTYSRLIFSYLGPWNITLHARPVILHYLPLPIPLPARFLRLHLMTYHRCNLLVMWFRYLPCHLKHTAGSPLLVPVTLLLPLPCLTTCQQFYPARFQTYVYGTHRNPSAVTTYHHLLPQHTHDLQSSTVPHATPCPSLTHIIPYTDYLVPFCPNPTFLPPHLCLCHLLPAVPAHARLKLCHPPTTRSHHPSPYACHDLLIPHACLVPSPYSP